MKRWLFLLLSVLSLIVVCVGYYLKPYFTPAEKQNGFSVMSHQDDTIRIAYIGDSWADRHKNVNCDIGSFVGDATGHPVVVGRRVLVVLHLNIYIIVFLEKILLEM